MIWQLSYVDSEISKIIQNRFSSRNMHSRDDNYRLGSQARKEDGKEEIKKKEHVTRQKLEDDESCCVCFADMKEDDNLTYCKTGCGKNVHTNCVEVWAKHK